MHRTASPPPSQPEPRAPRFSFGGRALVVSLLALTAMTQACPRLPDPDGCTPSTYRCSPDPAAQQVPQVCSQTQRWTNIDMQPCGVQPGLVCGLTYGRRGTVVAACLPAGGFTPVPSGAPAGALSSPAQLGNTQ